MKRSVRMDGLRLVVPYFLLRTIETVKWLLWNLPPLLLGTAGIVWLCLELWEQIKGTL